MTTTVNLTGTGVPGGTADAITGFVSLAQTATGASQGSLAFPSDIVEYTTSTAANGPTLPSTSGSGDTYTVVNKTANSINVWPASGFKINNGSADAAQAIAAGKSAQFISLGNGNWIAVVSA